MKMERKMRINVWASRGIEEDEYSYQADDFRITDGVLFLIRDGNVIAGFASGIWLSFEVYPE